MKRPYYLFSNGRLCRRQNTLCLEKATDARSPAAQVPGDGLPLGEVPLAGGDGASPVPDDAQDDGTPSGTLTGEHSTRKSTC